MLLFFLEREFCFSRRNSFQKQTNKLTFSLVIMACCTTIPPLNSTGQKRSSGGIFDLPKSAKRRRPFGSTSVTTVNAPLIASSLATNVLSSPTKLLTNSIFSNLNISNGPSSSTSHVIIDASDENNKKRSAFQTNNSPFGSSSTSSTHQQFEFKSELMERIKHEAKRLIKRKQASNLSTVNTGSTSNNSTDEDESSLVTTSPSSSPSSSSSLTQTTSSLSPHVNDNLLACNSKLTSVSSSNLILIPNATSITKTTTATTTTSNTLKRSNEATNINTNNRLNLAVTNHNDLPLFSMNQVNQICSGMIREREQLIREQYDKILAEKLSEQYDSFVKFTHEQIQRRFEKSQCSYVS